MHDDEGLTRSLARWASGDRRDEAQLMAWAYPILRAMAQKQLGSGGTATLQATELANEAFIRLVSGSHFQVADRARFLGLAAHVLRHVLVDHQRGKMAQKRGADAVRVAIEDAPECDLATNAHDTDWTALDEALVQLEAEDAAHARLVELRYVLGLTIEEAAELLGVSTATANRMWRFARSFLASRLAPEAAHDG